MNDPYVEMAKMLKERDNKIYSGYNVGEIVEDFPSIKIRTDENILLDKEELLFSAHLLRDYEWEYEIVEGEIQFVDTNCGDTTVDSLHSHQIESLNVDTNTLKSKGKIKWVNTIKKGDKVLLIPSGDEQTYVVIDKVVTL